MFLQCLGRPGRHDNGPSQRTWVSSCGASRSPCLQVCQLYLDPVQQLAADVRVADRSSVAPACICRQCRQGRQLQQETCCAPLRAGGRVCSRVAAVQGRRLTAAAPLTATGHSALLSLQRHLCPFSAHELRRASHGKIKTSPGPENRHRRGWTSSPTGVCYGPGRGLSHARARAHAESHLSAKLASTAFWQYASGAQACLQGSARFCA